MANSQRPYVPAAGHDWALPFYDPFVKLLGGEPARQALLEQANLQAGQRVLDIGCGTGTLAVLIKRQRPNVEVVGIDPDPKALARAGRKAARAGVAIQFDRGYGDNLPYPEASFDRVLSSLMFHHLEPADKERTLRAARRVLKPGGEFHMVDFVGAEDVHGFLNRLLHSRERLKDNSESRILELIQQAGFVNVEVAGHRAMLFGLGRVAYYKAAMASAAAAGGGR